MIIYSTHVLTRKETRKETNSCNTYYKRQLKLPGCLWSATGFWVFVIYYYIQSINFGLFSMSCIVCSDFIVFFVLWRTNDVNDSMLSSKKSKYWCQRNHSQENEPFPYSLCSFRFECYYRLSRVQVWTQHLHFYRIFHIFINSFLSSDENFGGRNLWHTLENVNNICLYFACTRRFTDLFDYVVIMVSVIRQGVFVYLFDWPFKHHLNFRNSVSLTLNQVQLATNSLSSDFNFKWKIDLDLKFQWLNSYKSVLSRGSKIENPEFFFCKNVK